MTPLPKLILGACSLIFATTLSINYLTPKVERLEKIQKNFYGNKVTQSYKEFISNIELVQGDIQIQGDEKFKKKINQVLNIIEKNTFYFEKVKKYISEIRQVQSDNDFGCIQPSMKTIILSNAYINKTILENLAGSIVHEATHSERYWTGNWNASRNLSNETKTNEELIAFQEEIKFLKSINAPEYLIKHIESQKGTHWKETKKRKVCR